VQWTCRSCGETHEGLPLDWGYDSPYYWDGPRGPEDVLSDDYCLWTDDDGRLCYFVRGLIEIPIVDSSDRFAYGVWSSLSKQSYSRFVELWDSPDRVLESPYFGWLSNSLPDYPETLSLPMDVATPFVDLRPKFVLHEGDHPLIREQREGITLARVEEIAARRMHGRSAGDQLPADGV
jgi:hypothetical protein